MTEALEKTGNGAAEALEKKRRELEIRETRVLVREKLAEKGMSAELEALIRADDRDGALEEIDRLERVFAREVDRQTEKRLAGRGGTLPGQAAVNEDDLSDREYYLLKGFKSGC